VTKPRGYIRTAEERFSCLLLVSLPYWQALLLAGISGMISFLLLTFLLLFVVSRSPTVYRIISVRLKALPYLGIALILGCRDRWLVRPTRTLVAEPSLAPSFQRPPPLFS